MAVTVEAASQADVFDPEEYIKTLTERQIWDKCNSIAERFPGLGKQELLLVCGHLYMFRCLCKRYFSPEYKLVGRFDGARECVPPYWKPISEAPQARGDYCHCCLKGSDAVQTLNRTCCSEPLV